MHWKHMRSEKLSIIIILGVVLLAVSCGKQPDTTSVSPAPITSTMYTMAEVAAANTAQKCWTTIDGNVYDLTTWIDQHPGGKANIMKLCGIDGAKEFKAQHGTQRKPAQELAGLLIGVLKQ